MNEVKKCHLKRSVAKSTVTKSTTRIRELIIEKGSDSKVRQFEEAKTKARDLTKRLKDLDLESIESDGR